MYSQHLFFADREKIQHLFPDLFAHHAHKGHGVCLELRAVVLSSFFDLCSSNAVSLEVHDHKLAVLFKKAVYHALQQHRVVGVQRGKVPHRPQQREAVLAPHRLRILANARGKITSQKSDDRAHIDGACLLVGQLALRSELFDLLTHALLACFAEKVKVLHHKVQRRAPLRTRERRFARKEFWFI